MKSVYSSVTNIIDYLEMIFSSDVHDHGGDHDGDDGYVR